MYTCKTLYFPSLHAEPANIKDKEKGSRKNFKLNENSVREPFIFYSFTLDRKSPMFVY